MMLIKIAWRNIWRNKVRSLVVLTSIALGIMAGLVTMALAYGLNNTRTKDAISTYISHIQIHNPEYKREVKLTSTLSATENLRNTLSFNENILGYSFRTLSGGMAMSANNSQGVLIQGIDPESEASVTAIHKKIVDGHYFKEVRKNPVVIGNALADKLKVKLNSKIVITFQDINNEIVTAAFRVNGIYKTANSKFDESTIFVQQPDLLKLLGKDGLIHQVAIMTKEMSAVSVVKNSLLNKFPEFQIEGWNEVAPDLGYADEMMSKTLYIFIGIILLAMAFGILNTMLMAVLERQKELGMLMAVGMNKVRIFLMILFETIFLALIAGPIGLGLAYWLNSYLGKNGIDLSMYGKGMEAYGISSIVYPELETGFYFKVATMVIIMAIISSIYPALKAIKHKPVESMRTI